MPVPTRPPSSTDSKPTATLRGRRQASSRPLSAPWQTTRGPCSPSPAPAPRRGFNGIPRRAGRPRVLNEYSEHRSQNPRGFYVAGTHERPRLFFCLSYPVRPTPSGIVACRLRSMCAMLLPRRPIRQPSKAGPAQGARVPDVTIHGVPTPAPNSQHVPRESPQRIATNRSRPS